MMEQGSVVETIFLVVDADDELAVEIGERITADDGVTVHRKDFWAHHQYIEERFLAREIHLRYVHDVASPMCSIGAASVGLVKPPSAIASSRRRLFFIILFFLIHSFLC